MNIDFKKIKERITKTALKLKETSGNVVEVAKTKYKLSEIKSNIDDKFIEIGKLIYDSSDEDITEQIEKICDEITELKAKYEDMQTIVDDFVNKKQCN